MHTLGFILAFGLVLIAPSLAGSSDSNVPGAGAFAYSGPSLAGSAPSAIMLATR